MAVELMPRPSLRDDYVRRRAAEMILPAIKRWAGADYRAKDEREWISDLSSVVVYGADGYEMSKPLERRGWAVDTELMEIMYGWNPQDAIDELTDQWVRCLGIRPQFELGASVFCPVRPNQIGVITRLDLRLAQYGVRYPDMKENCWHVVNFEDCSGTLTSARGAA